MTFDQKARASSFGAVAEQYDRARPRYPVALVDDLTDGKRLDVLDVGCGTGISSRVFSDRACTVHGVEHDERMADAARRDGMLVDVTRFEDWAPPPVEFDLVISGQAWHWIDPHAGPIKAADALVPGGQLAVFWIEYRHQPDVMRIFERIYREVIPELLATSHPLGRLGASAQDKMARDYATAMNDSHRFELAGVSHYTSQRVYSCEQWIDELPTHSDHQLLRRSTLAKLLSLLRGGLQPFGDHIEVEQRTHLVAARSRP